MPKQNSFKNNLPPREYLPTSIEKKFYEQEHFVSSVFVILKICFLLLAVSSLIKLGYSSKVRLNRLKEIQESFLFEKSRFMILSNRFDDLFSFEGEQRFMKDQDQIISRDIIRVIWR